MSIEVGNVYSMNNMSSGVSDSKSSGLTSKLSGVDIKNATDEQLMDVCNEFEEYLVEQVVKSMQNTVMKDDEEEEGSEYLDYFSDNMTQEYASAISKNNNLGIAQMLYESMKNNTSNKIENNTIQS